MLIVATVTDHHANEAMAQARRRFPQAVVRLIGGEISWWRALRLLRLWRGEQLSAVVLLSLQPALVTAVCRWFSCYKLLYNRWGEWYLIRRKTVREWVVGRRGADDRRYDWPPEGRRVRLLRRLADGLLAIPRGLRLAARAVALAGWVVWRIGWLWGRSMAYRLGVGR
jgi:hypothetical protein